MPYPSTLPVAPHSHSWNDVPPLNTAPAGYPAASTAYTPAVPGDWGPVPTEVGGALDQLAANAGGALAYAMFFALMPGDNAAPIAAGAPFLFPQDGAAFGGIVSTTSSTFTIPAIGVYSVFFQASIAEAGQMMLDLDSGAGFVLIANSVAGRATPTSQISNEVIITTTAVNSVLRVINPPGNPVALTLTATAGGTHSVSATLVIKQLA